MHDVSIYRGTDQPQWEPHFGLARIPQTTQFTNQGVFILDGVVAPELCQSLIAQFEDQETYPVGIDGYSNDDPDRIGSVRAMAWAPEMARRLQSAFMPIPGTLVVYRNIECRQFSIPRPDNLVLGPRYNLIGSTPWMRFMRYKGGGMHVPHYDAPFACPEERYITLFSWVLYLNDIPIEHGGSFDLVDDRNAVEALNRDDWRRMATDNEILLSIQPKAGRMIVFPHWLCHQVGPYRGNDHRYIIRGDVAYGAV